MKTKNLQVKINDAIVFGLPKSISIPIFTQIGSYHFQLLRLYTVYNFVRIFLYDTTVFITVCIHSISNNCTKSTYYVLYCYTVHEINNFFVLALWVKSISMPGFGQRNLKIIISYSLVICKLPMNKKL